MSGWTRTLLQTGSNNIALVVGIFPCMTLCLTMPVRYVQLFRIDCVEVVTEWWELIALLPLGLFLLSKNALVAPDVLVMRLRQRLGMSL